MRPLAIIQHQRSVPPGQLTRVLQDAGVEHFIVDAPRAKDWPSIAEIDALVVLGGTMNVDQLDEYPFLKRSRELMEDAINGDLPTLGVCLGAQMMARVLGAEVRRAFPRNALFSPLEVTDEGRDDPILAPFSSSVPVLQFHEDTFTVPHGTTLLANSVASGLVQAFRYGRHAYAIQFHFEVDRAIVCKWLTDIGVQRMVEEWDSPDGGRSLQEERYLGPQAKAGEELIRGFVNLAAGARRKRAIRRRVAG